VCGTVERSCVSDRYHTFASAADVTEQVRDRCRYRQQRGVRRQLLHRVALAGAARAELDKVEVPLAQWDETNQEEQLEPPIHQSGLVAHTSDNQVEPLVCGELSPEPLVLVEVKRRELDR